MDELNMDNILIGIPEATANMALPSPELRDYYRDEQNRVVWVGDICEETLEAVKFIVKVNMEDALLSPSERKPITLMINSYGGDVSVLLSLIKAIEISKTPVRTVCYCNAMSAAADLLACGTAGMRFCMPGTTVMMHSGSASYTGTQAQVEAAKKYYDAMGKRVIDHVMSRTNIDAKTAKKMKDDYYMSETEALSLGIIDHIVSDFSEIM